MIGKYNVYGYIFELRFDHNLDGVYVGSSVKIDDGEWMSYLGLFSWSFDRHIVRSGTLDELLTFFTPMVIMGEITTILDIHKKNERNKKIKGLLDD
jgi:hypothetical protein